MHVNISKFGSEILNKDVKLLSSDPHPHFIELFSHDLKAPL